MSEKDQILARIREALKSSAPLPGHHDTPTHARFDTLPVGDARQWLPAVGASFDERLALFRKNAEDLKARFCLLDGLDGLAKELLEMRDAEGWQRIAAHAGALTDAACGTLGLPLCRTDQGYDVAELESCDAGVTECDGLV